MEKCIKYVRYLRKTKQKTLILIIQLSFQLGSLNQLSNLIQHLPSMECLSLSTGFRNRRSFKNHQVPKRHYAKPILIVIIFLLVPISCLVLLYNHYTQFVHVHIDRRQVEDLQIASKMETYKLTYCSDQSKCQKQNIEVLTAILTLLVDTSSYISQRKQQIGLKISSFSKSHTNHGQSLNRLQIGLPALIESNKQSSGRSKLTQLQLHIVKNPKVTTAMTTNIFDDITSYFINMDTYKGIDHILEEGNEVIWKPNTPAVSIAVRSSKRMKPKVIQIILERVASCQLNIYGLSVTFDQKAVIANIGMHQIKAGVNRINCLIPECEEEHDALIFKMGSVDVRSLRVFQATNIDEVL